MVLRITIFLTLISFLLLGTPQTSHSFGLGEVLGMAFTQQLGMGGQMGAAGCDFGYNGMGAQGASSFMGSNLPCASLPDVCRSPCSCSGTTGMANTNSPGCTKCLGFDWE